MNTKPYLSIVIPAYKEEKRLPIILDAIIKYGKTKSFLMEVVVAVDGSADDTAAVANSYRDKIPNLVVSDRKVNKGKGYTVKEGVMMASGQYILFADADNSTPIEQVDKLLRYIESYSVIIGSRYSDDGKIAVPQSLTRRLGSRVLNFVIQTLAISGIKDTQCGFKLFEAKAAKEIFERQTIDGFSFDIEILVIAKQLGYKIKEVGVDWYDSPHSTVDPIKDGLRMVKAAYEIHKNRLAGIYR